MGPNTTYHFWPYFYNVPRAVYNALGTNTPEYKNEYYDNWVITTDSNGNGTYQNTTVFNLGEDLVGTYRMKVRMEPTAPMYADGSGTVSETVGFWTTIFLASNAEVTNNNGVVKPSALYISVSPSSIANGALTYFG